MWSAGPAQARPGLRGRVKGLPFCRPAGAMTAEPRSRSRHAFARGQREGTRFRRDSAIRALQVAGLEIRAL